LILIKWYLLRIRMLLWGEVPSCKLSSITKIQQLIIRMGCFNPVLTDLVVIEKILKLQSLERTLKFSMKKTTILKQRTMGSKVHILAKLIEVQIRLLDLLSKKDQMVDNYQVAFKLKCSTISLSTKKRIHLMASTRLNKDSHTWKKCKKWVRFQDQDLMLTTITTAQPLQPTLNLSLEFLLNKASTRFRHQEEEPSSSKSQSTSTIIMARQLQGPLLDPTILLVKWINFLQLGPQCSRTRLLEKILSTISLRIRIIR
jgi:hypothetical protein